MCAKNYTTISRNGLVEQHQANCSVSSSPLGSRLASPQVVPRSSADVSYTPR